MYKLYKLKDKVICMKEIHTLAVDCNFDHGECQWSNDAFNWDGRWYPVSTNEGLHGFSMCLMSSSTSSMRYNSPAVKSKNSKCLKFVYQIQSIGKLSVLKRSKG